MKGCEEYAEVDEFNNIFLYINYLFHIRIYYDNVRKITKNIAEKYGK